AGGAGRAARSRRARRGPPRRSPFLPWPMHYDARDFFLEEAMALKATKAEVWAATIEDRAGGAADKLEALARGGANLEMLLARRTDQPGQGVMFVTPVKGPKPVQAAPAPGS